MIPSIRAFQCLALFEAEMNHIARLQARFSSSSYRDGSARAVRSDRLNLVNLNFGGICPDCRCALGNFLEKRRLDVPNIKGFIARLLFDVPGYSRFDCFHVGSVSRGVHAFNHCSTLRQSRCESVSLQTCVSGSQLSLMSRS
jgi:hypothetical protein